MRTIEDQIPHPAPTQLQQQSKVRAQHNEQPQVNYAVPEDGVLPGGRLKYFLENWKRITTHPWPLSVIEHGYRLQFTKTPQSMGRSRSFWKQEFCINHRHRKEILCPTSLRSKSQPNDVRSSTARR
ncbi:hypothetical protein G6F43_013737 [Rhizopus delemar]|nr:hypothetical protein G6F43_013737 [Rhizopus delemar]